MPRKGKGRGRGRGTAREPQDECRPGQPRVLASEQEETPEHHLSPTSQIETNVQQHQQLSRQRTEPRSQQQSTVEASARSLESELRQQYQQLSRQKTEPRSQQSTVEASARSLESEVRQQQQLSRHRTEPKSQQQSTEASSTRSLESELRQLTFHERPFEGVVDLPPKPSPGRAGRIIKLIANYFPVEMPHGYVYHYDVEVIPIRGKQQTSTDKKYRCLSTQRNREVINQMVRICDAFRGNFHAYDGQKNLITRDRLPKSLKKIPVSMTSDGEKDDLFEVYIKPVIKKDSGDFAINLEPLHALFEGKIRSISQEAVMAIEIILRQSPTLKSVPIGRSFFKAPDSGISLGSGREIWFGYHQSLQLTQWKPMLNINMAATTFYESGPVLDFICKILKCSKEDLRAIRSFEFKEIQLLSKELKGLRVEVNHMKYKRKYRIVNVTRDPANKLTFPMDVDGRQILKTVSDYFLEQYKRRLQYPNFPCLQVGSVTKKVFLPVEVCNLISGQHCKKKLDERQTADMIKQTACPPAKRFQNIDQIVRNANFNNDPILRGFNIKISTQPLQLEGRIINPPKVSYNNNQTIVPKQGQWNMQDKVFFQGADINNWVLLSFSGERYCSRQILSKFANMLCESAQNCGIEIRRPSLIEIYKPHVKIFNLLQQMIDNYKADLAVVVISTRYSNYAEIKCISETKLGLVTQCIKDNNVIKVVNRNDQALLSNLCQKINAKMGGVNNALMRSERPVLFNSPVIIIGADVTHPAPGDKIKPSIAAAVGSLDSYPSRYAVSIRVQARKNDLQDREEIIVKLKEMVKELLLAFHRHTKGRKPEKIIFYRDGVSEGQFSIVQQKELSQIREACSELDRSYQPAITFIVVQKRHHTRFRPFNINDGVGKAQNIPPGTTVDQTVTHPLNFDFFLCSHYGIQGTSRPSHYTVIWDDNDFSADELQKLSYYLCHIYARCTRSISIPAPVMYAHLAAFRARQYIISEIGDASSDSSYSTVIDSKVIDAVKFIKELTNTMFFV